MIPETVPDTPGQSTARPELPAYHPRGWAQGHLGGGGTLTGLGADIIIVDDPVKPSDARGAMRKNANGWLDNTLLSRLNSKLDGAIVIIMQRLHLDDTVGHVLQHGGWEVVSLPAIAIEARCTGFVI